MKLRIPRQHEDGLASLVGYSAQDLSRITELVATSGPMNAVTSLGKSVATAGGFDEEEIIDLLYAIGSLLQARDTLEASTVELIPDLHRALSRHKDERLHPQEESWPGVQDCLRRLMEADGSLVLTAKASSLRHDQAKTFCLAKIVSDIRPILDVAENRPVAAMVLHSLRITYHEGPSKPSSIYISMTKEQLVELKTVLDRALEKDEGLAQVASAAGLTVLNQGE